VGQPLDERFAKFAYSPGLHNDAEQSVQLVALLSILTDVAEQGEQV
jgi:uncharacterized protein affecting Mg2+/Co2+ transport